MKTIILRFTNITHGERKNKGVNENSLGYNSLLVLPVGSSFLLCLFISVTGVLKPQVGISNLVLNPRCIHILNERTQL